MKAHILEVLNQIEKEQEIKILYACEAGSRAQDLASKDSDYDVRFIYVHTPNWYLSIDQKRDVIERSNQDQISIPVHPLLDLNGWELTKALRLLRKSNPSLLEWLQSNIVYYQAYSSIEKIRAMEKKVFSPKSCVYHYLQMSKRNLREIQGNTVGIKKYLNVLRPILAAKWIEKHNTIPPIEFQVLLDDLLETGEGKEKHFSFSQAKSG